jgi:phosphate transport system protein
VAEHRHIDARYDAELNQLKERVIAMGKLVELQLEASVTAFTQRDLLQALAVERDDHGVNELERNIDEHAVRLLALHQPAASDLRLLAAVLKIVTDLERIGDLAVDTARRTRALDDAPIQNPAELLELAQAALLTLRQSLDAFLRTDVARARRIVAADGKMDGRVADLIAQLRRTMTGDPQLVANSVATLMAAMHLQRMAAHARNIAEMAVYTGSGEDVRHAT